MHRCQDIPADVYFLADNTGSMGDYIAAVRAGASQILGNLTANISNLYTGGGAYRDRGRTNPLAYNFIFRNTASLTNGTSGAQSAINAWSASGGGDEPEAQLYALYLVGTCPLASP